MSSAGPDQSVSMSDYLAVLRRRKYLILGTVLATPLAALVFSVSQQHLYSASAQVLLQSENIGNILTGTDTSSSQDPTRVSETQAALARVPDVARRVVSAVQVPGLTAGKLLQDSAVAPQPDTDLLVFSVTSTDPDLAAKLATAYARAYTSYRTELDTNQLKTAREELQLRIDELRAGGVSPTSPLLTTLLSKAEQLRTAEALQTSRATLVRPASSGDQIQPRTVRNVALAIMLGGLLGVGLALLGDAIDKRVRNEHEVEGVLGIPLLGRLAEPPRRLRGRLAMANEPQGLHGEAYRSLKTNIDFVNQSHHARTLMVTSAAEREGKSTTAANLAMTFARAGKRVLLVDLDLRQPSVDRIFNLPQKPGLSDVAIGAAELKDAITTVAVPGGARIASAVNGAKRGSHVVGLLEVLPAGTRPPNPGEFVGSQAIASILDEVKSHGDIVIVDAPPTLAVGDVMTLSPLVDGLLVVVRLSSIKRPVLKELARVLATMPVPKLGFVLTGIGPHESYGYVSADYHRPPQEEREPTQLIS
jgi:succinoglycan biosynthesis transport protein ExoP